MCGPRSRGIEIAPQVNLLMNRMTLHEGMAMDSSHQQRRQALYKLSSAIKRYTNYGATAPSGSSTVKDPIAETQDYTLSRHDAAAPSSAKEIHQRRQAL